MSVPSALKPQSGGALPTLLYGTAWKEERTRDLVLMALRAGYRGVDTANQRRHYHEAGVGEALRAAFASGLVRREELFIQTKFTHLPGHDHRLPFQASAAVGEQVAQSAASSLEHLGVTWLDSLVLHGPMLRTGLHPADAEAWRAMEELHDRGVARALGASNVTAAQLEDLCGIARVQPSFVQDRCFARRRWNADVRGACRERGIAYQGFSLLTANPEVLADPAVQAMAKRRGVPAASIVFAFARAVGMIPLTGTTDERHARDDLAAVLIALDRSEVALIERLAAS